MRISAVVDFLHGLLLLTASCRHTLATSSARLPSYPLAVKSPYLSTWVPGALLSDAATARPQFWTGAELTWPILARVDGTTYALFGSPEGLTSDIHTAKTVDVTYSSTHTYIELSAASVNFTLDFFTPVYPRAQDYALQSLPYSYLTIGAKAFGYASPKVQVFTAIDQTWTAQNGAAGLNLTTSGDAGFFWFHNPDEIPFTENSDMATYGSVTFGTTFSGDTTFDCNNANSVYSDFASDGALSNSSRTCSGTYLAGIAKDLGHVGSLGKDVTFVVGFDRVQAINYLNATQTGYYRTRWPTVPEAFSYFLGRYTKALADSKPFDAQVRTRTESVSSQYGNQYADICEASVRQAFAAMELTVPADDLTAPVWAFLKEISSDGNVNTVDLIFQSWPIFVNLNPEWIILQFLPTLQYLASGRWPKDFVIHDIGTHYPNATGHDDGMEEDMPLFETSSLFILMLVYQKFSGDNTYTQKYHQLLEGYAEYLANNSLYPASQLISVDAIPATANQTALAIQSAIGLKAVSILTGNKTYAVVGERNARVIYNDALGLNGKTLEDSTHFTYNYGDPDPWNVVFASYSDVILNLNTFPRSAWDMQSKWYLSQVQELGLPWAGPVSDRGVDWALTDWNIMTAAVSSPELQQVIVNTTYAYLTDGKNDIPFGTKYHVEGPQAGIWIANKARGTVGTHFAITALQQGLWA